MKMKAAILEKLNAPLVIDELEIPVLECGQVLIEVHASGICGKQIGEISGHYGKDPYLPHLLGHEGGGIVADVGPGVTQVNLGDFVVMHWRKGLGIESNCPMYKRKAGEVGAGSVATFSEFAIVSENRLTRIDIDIPFDIAALMGCSVTTALGLINNEAKLKIGQSIAIIGCGGIGLMAIQGAAMVSAYPIVAIDTNENKWQMALECGATYAGTYIIDENYDVIVDTTGRPDLIATAYNLIAPGGKVIMVGQPRYDQDLTIPSIAANFTRKCLKDSQGGLTNPSVDIPRYLELYRRGILKLDNLITHRYPLDEVNEAIEMVKSGQAGRVMLEMK